MDDQEPFVEEDSAAKEEWVESIMLNVPRGCKVWVGEVEGVNEETAADMAIDVVDIGLEEGAFQASFSSALEASLCDAQYAELAEGADPATRFDLGNRFRAFMLGEQQPDWREGAVPEHSPPELLNMDRSSWRIKMRNFLASLRDMTQSGLIALKDIPLALALCGYSLEGRSEKSAEDSMIFDVNFYPEVAYWAGFAKSSTGVNIVSQMQPLWDLALHIVGARGEDTEELEQKRQERAQAEAGNRFLDWPLGFSVYYGGLLYRMRGGPSLGMLMAKDLL